MKSRYSLAIIVGALAVYFLANTAFAGYGLYLAHEVLNGPTEASGEATELREQYGTVVTGFVIFGAAGLLAAASAFGLAHRSRWGQFVWLATSGAIVLAILYSVLALGASLFSHYLFVLAAIAISWWYLAAQRKAHNEA